MRTTPTGCVHRRFLLYSGRAEGWRCLEALSAMPREARTAEATGQPAAARSCRGPDRFAPPAVLKSLVTAPPVASHGSSVVEYIDRNTRQFTYS